jgi:predicted metal-binding membrane protein
LIAGSPQPTPLERGLARERALILAGLIGSVALVWAWLVPVALDMYGDMRGPAAWMMQLRWDAPYALLMFGMWSAMMLGMMLPSAAPLLLIYGAVLRRSGEPAAARVYAFAAGYLLVWTAFSLGATALQFALRALGLLSPMMEARSLALGGALLLLAGAYQFTPLKRSCLDSCRNPAVYLSQGWRRGAGGALRMGLGHGLYCLGCCWALMLLLFVGGVMNLLWIAAISVFVLLEKLAPRGVQGGRLSGALLAAAGAALLLFSLLRAVIVR